MSIAAEHLNGTELAGVFADEFGETVSYRPPETARYVSSRRTSVTV
ncbi:hypothetical protein R6V09_07525 [Streptomyces sp. W16]|nr:hypothetical protein [Streptomyces sp. W16]MDV9169987.1 hypothetical protein [Streptomyces sp. W16]